MGNRRKARELAMQALFFMDMQKEFSQESFGRFCANFAPSLASALRTSASPATSNSAGVFEPSPEMSMTRLKPGYGLLSNSGMAK